MKFSKALILSVFCVGTVFMASADKLVILHTNDTHSQIDPDDKDNLGGIARRKVVIDSVRGQNDNVLLIDAGDIVQGTLYFNLFGGEVENRLMQLLGYDFRILGNHEFDNGVDALAKMLAEDSLSTFLATNYDLSASPLKNKFEKYAIKEFGDRRIGFIAINLRPEGMISEGNYNGVEYLDAIEAANASAWWLKNVENCDMVVAITHIGYDPAMPPGDLNLAASSSNIDVIIGGHSHDLIDPSDDVYKWLVPNRNGNNVLVTQVGKSGKNIGQITIDLDNLSKEYSLIAIDERLDGRTDGRVTDLISPYRAGVDSLMARPVGRTLKDLPQASPALVNLVADIVFERGSQIADNVDFAIINKGGLRRGLTSGTVTEGEIITMLPFNNRVRVIDILGKDLLPAFEQMARVGGNGVSESVRAEYSLNPSDKSPVMESITINGIPLDPEKTYRMATIDYLANGGDYMSSLTRGTQVVESPTVLYNDVLDYFYKLNNTPVDPSDNIRFVVRQ